MGKLNLRQLILLLTLATAVLVLGNTFYTSYKAQRALLIEQTLETNQAYAAKLASNIEDFLHATQEQLAFAAQDILMSEQDPQQLEHIVERLKKQTHSFNSVLIVDAEGVILAASDAMQGLLGKKLRSTGSLQALAERVPIISSPFNSVAKKNRPIIFISHPIFDEQGTYLGYVGGSIYLNEKSILHTLLGEHYHADGSFIYAVSQEGRLIYHQRGYRVGELVDDNAVVAKVLQGEAGSSHYFNTTNIEMLAGYAYIPLTGWGVITQRSLAATLSGMDKQMRVVAQYSFPFFVFIVLVAWVMSRWISKPLAKLAHSAKDLNKAGVATDISNVPAWYYEASQLKRAMLRGLAGVNETIGQLNLENITDPLTGLVNRRGMQAMLAEWEQRQYPFSVITGDIDHFKRINDEFGHDVGDEVLKFLAQHMQASSRPDDLVCRTGGEEFIILLPKTDAKIAYKAAQRLNERLAKEVFPDIGRTITLSFGVACWPCAGMSIAEVMKSADQALYKAKQAGRNRVQKGPECNDANAGG